jgi:acetyltransferase-like isoleucine patch superfamily enzyme
MDKVIKEAIAPMLIGSGCCAYLDPLYIAAEGEIVLRIIPGRMNLVQSVVMLMGVHYVFNVKYAKEGKNFFAFMEAVLLNNCDIAKKRVVVNKVLQDLDTV